MLSFLPPNFSREQAHEFLDVEMENFRDQAEDENVLALILGGSAERLDGEAGDRDADVNEAFVGQGSAWTWSES